MVVVVEKFKAHHCKVSSKCTIKLPILPSSSS